MGWGGRQPRGAASGAASPRRSAACASFVIESASSRITSLIPVLNSFCVPAVAAMAVRWWVPAGERAEVAWAAGSRTCELLNLLPHHPDASVI